MRKQLRVCRWVLLHGLRMEPVSPGQLAHDANTSARQTGVPLSVPDTWYPMPVGYRSGIAKHCPIPTGLRLRPVSLPSSYAAGWLAT